MAYQGQSKESREYEAKRDALANTVITSGAEVAELPYHGNAWSDMGLFRAVGKFIATTPDREEARKALYNMGVYGMGLDENEPVTDEALDQAIEMERAEL
jgi:hypothetical protein